MIDDYINKINLKKGKDNLKQEILFGQGMGLIIFIFAGLKFLSTTNAFKELIMECLMTLGIFLLLTGLIFPYVLYYPSKFVKEIINKLFIAVLVCILTVVYIILIIPVGLIKKKKWAQKYGFFSWNKEETNIQWKGFSNCNNITNNINKTNKRENRFKRILRIVGYFMERKNFILIPLLCLLLLIGLLFFFVTSSVVTPMIYTLF